MFPCFLWPIPDHHECAPFVAEPLVAEIKNKILEQENSVCLQKHSMAAAIKSCPRNSLEFVVDQGSVPPVTEQD